MIFKAGDSNGAKQYGIVPIDDDQIVEDTEQFVVRLTSIDSGLTTSTFSSTTINIIDNDSKSFFGFYLANYQLISTAQSCNIIVISTPSSP